MFLEPHPIGNQKELKDRTTELLGQFPHLPGNQLFISAYTGEWLLNADYERHLSTGEVRITLLVDDFQLYPDSPHSKVARIE